MDKIPSLNDGNGLVRKYSTNNITGPKDTVLKRSAGHTGGALFREDRPSVNIASP